MQQLKSRDNTKNRWITLVTTLYDTGWIFLVPRLGNIILVAGDTPQQAHHLISSQNQWACRLPCLFSPVKWGETFYSCWPPLAHHILLNDVDLSENSFSITISSYIHRFIITFFMNIDTLWVDPQTHDPYHVWLVVWNMTCIFPFSWECHHPNRLIFFRGVGIPPNCKVILPVRNFTLPFGPLVIWHSYWKLPFLVSQPEMILRIPRDPIPASDMMMFGG